MKNNLTCELVEDLMPSYIDGLTSEVTNNAMREHIAHCDKCKAKLDNMKEPYSEGKIEEEKKEIDFLKKARKRNIKTVISSIVAIILIVAVGACTLPYMESERLCENDIIYDLEVKDGTFKLTMKPVSNEIVITDVIREEFGFGEVGLNIRGKKRSPFGHRETYTWEYTPESTGSVKTLKILNKILWKEGQYISDITWEAYNTKHLYMGDMSANSRTASALGIYDYLGSHTNKLQSTKEPYEWRIILSYELLSKQVKEKEELMKKYAYAILGIIENLGAVTFEYEIFNPEGEDKMCELTVTREQAKEFFGDDIGKCYDDINELQRLMEKTGLSDMPYPQQNDKDSFDVDVNEVARVELFNASDAEIKKIELYCRETETMAAHGFVDDWKFNIDKNPVVTDVEMNIWLESDLLSSNLYDESRLGNLTVEVKVYDWDDNVYEVQDVMTVSAQFGAVYHFTLGGSFEEGFYIKTK